MTTAQATKPSNICIDSRLADLALSFNEKIVAASVILVCRHKGDKWSPFSWQDYINNCGHSAIGIEQDILDEKFVGEEFLSREDGLYGVQAKFINALTTTSSR